MGRIRRDPVRSWGPAQAPAPPARGRRGVLRGCATAGRVDCSRWDRGCRFPGLASCCTRSVPCGWLPPVSPMLYAEPVGFVPLPGVLVPLVVSTNDSLPSRVAVVRNLTFRLQSPAYTAPQLGSCVRTAVGGPVGLLNGPGAFEP